MFCFAARSAREFLTKLRHTASCGKRRKSSSLQSEDEIFLAGANVQIDGDVQRAVDWLVAQVGIAEVQQHLWPGEDYECFCMRFLRARKFNVEKALAMLKSDLKWRAEHVPKALVMKSALDVVGLSEDDLWRCLPMWHQGFDREGRPVMIQDYGKLRLPELMRRTTMDCIHNHHIRETEFLAKLCGQQTLKLDRVIDKWTVVVDADSWDARNLFYPAIFKWFSHLADVDQNHYPERLATMVIINAPPVLYRFWSMIQPLIDTDTKQKIMMFASREEWLPVLHNIIDPAELGPEYGGSGQCNFHAHVSINSGSQESALHDDDAAPDSDIALACCCGMGR